MSATNAPYGLKAVFHPSGTIRTETFFPQSINASACYKGDPVKLTGGTDVVSIATGSNAIIGVFDGCRYTDATGKPTYSAYWPASLSGVTNIEWYVITDPMTVFEVQGAGSVAATAVGDSADLTIATGNANTGISGSYLATGSLSGAATVKQWRIMGLGGATDNAWGDTYTNVRVTIGQSQRFTETNAI